MGAHSSHGSHMLPDPRLMSSLCVLVIVSQFTSSSSLHERSFRSATKVVAHAASSAATRAAGSEAIRGERLYLLVL